MQSPSSSTGKTSKERQQRLIVSSMPMPPGVNLWKKHQETKHVPPVLEIITATPLQQQDNQEQQRPPSPLEQDPTYDIAASSTSLTNNNKDDQSKLMHKQRKQLIQLQTQLWDAQRLIQVILGNNSNTDNDREDALDVSKRALHAIRAYALLKQDLKTREEQCEGLQEECQKHQEEIAQLQRQLQDQAHAHDQLEEEWKRQMVQILQDLQELAPPPSSDNNENDVIPKNSSHRRRTAQQVQSTFASLLDTLAKKQAARMTAEKDQQIASLQEQLRQAGIEPR